MVYARTVVISVQEKVIGRPLDLAIDRTRRSTKLSYESQSVVRAWPKIKFYK